MPLIQGSSEASIHSNIKKLIGEGHKRKQAIAIAYNVAEKSKHKTDQEQGKAYRYKNSCMSGPPKEPQEFPYL
jgi:hypothetical protein